MTYTDLNLETVNLALILNEIRKEIYKFEGRGLNCAALLISTPLYEKLQYLFRYERSFIPKTDDPCTKVFDIEISELITPDDFQCIIGLPFNSIKLNNNNLIVEL